MIKFKNMLTDVIEDIYKNKNKIEAWISSYKINHDFPIYHSVDIRDADYKISVVDTNLFPAGFNNLCKIDLQEASNLIKQAILKRVPKCEKILLYCEYHTRNKGYLENIFSLQLMLQNAGFKVDLAATFTEDDSQEYIVLNSLNDNELKILNTNMLDTSIYNVVVLNNDLTSGVPKFLDEIQIPVFPSSSAGWYSRSKRKHFLYANKLIKDFSNMLGIDPWLFSCLFSTVEDVDINEAESRGKLYEASKKLFKQIKEKYEKFDIKEKPFIFLKADTGTYGMGVLAIEEPEEILNLNRNARKKLYKGKSAVPISSFLLQEGVPGKTNKKNLCSEICVYSIDNDFIGGFYRMNERKSFRQNLNSSGMYFMTMHTSTWHNKKCKYVEKLDFTCNDVLSDAHLYVFQVLSEIAGLAAFHEIMEMQGN
jgi:glutamate--cysteine ligase